MWIVRLIKKPAFNDFPEGYFPRTVYYFKQAKDLVAEVERKGGKAEILKDKTGIRI